MAGSQRIVQRLIATPVTRSFSLGWILRAMNFGLDEPEEKFTAFENLLASQDIPIVESQRPENLPLDLQAELHLRSDRTAIALPSVAPEARPLLWHGLNARRPCTKPKF